LREALDQREDIGRLLPAHRVAAVGLVVPVLPLLGDVVVEGVGGVRRDAEELEHPVVARTTGQRRLGLPLLTGSDHG
jgi:hypothetical protein